MSKNKNLKEVLSKIKLHGAGEQMKSHSDSLCRPGSDKNNVVYPTLWLNTKQVPELKGKEVEDEIVFIVKAKIVSHSLRESEKENNENFDLKIKKIGLIEN